MSQPITVGYEYCDDDRENHKGGDECSDDDPANQMINVLMMSQSKVGEHECSDDVPGNHRTE